MPRPLWATATRNGVVLPRSLSARDIHGGGGLGDNPGILCHREIDDIVGGQIVEVCPAAIPGLVDNTD